MARFIQIGGAVYPIMTAGEQARARDALAKVHAAGVAVWEGDPADPSSARSTGWTFETFPTTKGLQGLAESLSEAERRTSATLARERMELAFRSKQQSQKPQAEPTGLFEQTQEPML